MEIRYADGRSEMESFDDMNELQAEMAARLKNPDVVSVTAHKVGSRTKQNGREYELNALGQWVRVGKKRKSGGAES